MIGKFAEGLMLLWVKGCGLAAVERRDGLRYEDRVCDRCRPAAATLRVRCMLVMQCKSLILGVG